MVKSYDELGLTDLRNDAEAATLSRLAGNLSSASGMNYARCQITGNQATADKCFAVTDCADIGPSDMLEYYFADPDTKVIGMYIETARDARRIFEILRAEKARKPVVLLKGGRTKLGLAAAVSHTGSLAGDDRAWVALSRQTGCILTESLDEFIDTLLIFQTLTPRADKPTERVVLFGNGGGASVLATDTYARLGLEVAPFPADTIAALAELNLPPGTSITNPVDCPVGTLSQDEGRVAEKVLDIIYASGKPDAVVMHLNLSAFAGRVKPEVLDNLMAAAIRVQEKYPGQAHFMLALRSDGAPALERGLPHSVRANSKSPNSTAPGFGWLLGTSSPVSSIKLFTASFTLKSTFRVCHCDAACSRTACLNLPAPRRPSNACTNLLT